MMADQRGVVSIRVDKELWKRCKKVAVDRDITLSKLVEEALVDWLKK